MTTSVENSQVPEHRIKIKSCNFVGFWSHNLINTNCVICRNDLTIGCVECDETSKKCPISKGQCGHGSHKHCIDKWILKTNSDKCVVCNQEWNVVTKNESGIGKYFN